MYASKSSGKKASSDFDQTIQLSARVDGAEHLLEQVAETQNGDELDYRMNRGADSRGNVYARQTDYDWTRSTEVGPDRRFGETLAQQEERIGREAEQARHSATARAAHADGVDREASSRQLTEAETERADGFGAPADPRDYMDQEALAEVNQRAAIIAAETNMTQAAASRRMAAYVSGQFGDCEGIPDAALTTYDDAREKMDAPTPIAELSPYGYEATIEGEVTHIIDEPASYNQYQVCYVEDDQGTSAKVTVWSKSVHGGEMVQTLREGDRVRISGGKPDEYNGTKTVAVTSETCIYVLERGDGPAPTGEARSSFGCDGASQTVAPWRADSDTHQWANDRDMDRAAAVTLDETSQMATTDEETETAVSVSD
ncbi:SOSS complex subunit B family protein [Haloarcula salinisoli]|uniref:Uncharacterized protein n=1 Tax=Haloarcula salinisoli TaxID=2487746 RepID=A0A8J8C9J1_9EURY|nr:SOSS complex subunit B family protein [Halomicroarcula salinisoli]MBX0305666.1 hypothetical protein [Halomicroarcula salinisoli]